MPLKREKPQKNKVHPCTAVACVLTPLSFGAHVHEQKKRHAFFVVVVARASAHCSASCARVLQELALELDWNIDVSESISSPGCFL